MRSCPTNAPTRPVEIEAITMARTRTATLAGLCIEKASGPRRVRIKTPTAIPTRLAPFSSPAITMSVPAITSAPTKAIADRIQVSGRFARGCRVNSAKSTALAGQRLASPNRLRDWIPIMQAPSTISAMTSAAAKGWSGTGLQDDLRSICTLRLVPARRTRHLTIVQGIHSNFLNSSP